MAAVYYAASIPAWQIAVLFLAILVAWLIPFEGLAWVRRHEPPELFDWGTDLETLVDLIPDEQLVVRFNQLIDDTRLERFGNVIRLPKRSDAGTSGVA